MQHFFLLVWVLLGDWKNLQLAPLTIFSGFPNNRHNSLPRMPGPQKAFPSMCYRTLLLGAGKAPLRLLGDGLGGSLRQAPRRWARGGLNQRLPDWPHNNLPRHMPGVTGCTCLHTGHAGTGLAAHATAARRSLPLQGPSPS